MNGKNNLFVLAAASLLAVSPMFAGETPPTTVTKPDSTKPAYLGVVVISTHPALAANLQGVLKPDQGLTVEEVAANSPAGKAGIKMHDVLTAFDDQRLYSTDQFVKLVRSEQPGREVSLEFLRDGKLQTVRLALGTLNPSDVRAWTPSEQAQPFRFGRPDRVLRQFRGQPAQAEEWSNFDSLTLKKSGADEFRVELQLRDKDGKLHQHVFAGSREAIHTALEADKDLKVAERAHVLRSLHLHCPGDDSPFPHIWYEPGVGWFFEQPGGTFH